ncbi:glyoxysomal fatty acid beta-oxidation multifunctional protein MFP-a isoform X2 [Capsicum annuum]|uniref:glyoxysomal fatty acid beta-oxidation multifunctional protein MFP-a isoform X2 n=1 Tax=Capsicum annuum TaxID=4072 RepID=UPI001FB11D03|nr:glyoxysomal fatty acid beta-oxidation multifunctional protein MFP-a isoform X2 [Capsicum annuum]
MKSKGRATIEVAADGVAVITIINPPVNSLSLDVLYSLKETIEDAFRRDDVKAIVMTGYRGKFSGGFNISSFADLQQGKVAQPKPGYTSLDMLTDTVEVSRKPLVAAIDGHALGGGLEIAMCCHARISTPNAKLGLPELHLGIIPGFGGTQRLPRLVGLAKSLEMMLTAKSVKGKEALDLGLVDAIVSPSQLLDAACKWALDIWEHKKPWNVASLYRTDKLESLDEAREILKLARDQAIRISPNLYHPLAFVDVVEEGIVSGPRAGLIKEYETFEVLIRSGTCKALVHIFLSRRGTTKIPGVTDLGLVPRHVIKVAILGGGLMGSEIATVFLLSNYYVILKEVNNKVLEAGIHRIKANLQRRTNKGKLSQAKFVKALSLLKGTLDYETFRDVDMVIEAVTEDLTLKQKIFMDLEKYCAPHCILASNTSIDLNLIGEKIKSQDRIIGAHFFSPAHMMPLLEIVRNQKTSSQVIVDLLDVGKKIKKTPVVVRNCTGFAVNRMFFSCTQAALLLVEHGADIYCIDRAFAKFGMAMGPFRLCDLIGLDVAMATEAQFVLSMSDRIYKSTLIPLMQQDKRLGETTQKGFYLYDERHKVKPDPEIKKYIEKAREISGVSINPKLAKLSDKDIVEMILFPSVNEACRLLAECIVVKAADLDIASVMGMGFPPYRGGTIYWADTLGSKYICSRLNGWARMYGNFFKPCDSLVEKASRGVPLSGMTDPAKPRL